MAKRGPLPLGQMALYAHAAILVVAPFLRGGYPGWAVVAIAALATAAFVLTRFAHPEVAVSGTRRDLLTPLIWITVGYTALQALPLPCGVVALVSPEAVNATRRSLALLGESPVLCSMSLDPGATRTELLKGVAIVQVFLAARILARAGGRRPLQLAVVASSLAMALVAIASALFGDTPFGQLDRAAERPALAPLLNDNNLGGFVALSVPLCLGLALQERVAARRPLWYVGAVISSFVVLLSASRGAIAALLLGVLLLSALLLRRLFLNRRAPGRRGRAAALSLAGALVVPAGAGLLGYLGLADTFLGIAEEGTSKLDKIAAAAAFSFEQPLLGVGRGAFASGFADLGGKYRAFYAESFPVQWGAEWGYPLALALTGALLYALLRALPRARPARLGAVAGLLSLAAQNLADLGSESLGIAVVAISLVGSTSATRVSRRRGRRGDSEAPPAPRLRPTPRQLWFPAVAVLALAVLGVDAARFDYDGSVAALRAAAPGAEGPVDGTVARIIRLHPAEPTYPLLVAAGYARARPADAGPWLNRALQLAPDWPEAHVQTALWLRRAGLRRQALLEVRMAAAGDPHRAASIFCVVAGRKPPAQDVRTAAPPGAQGTAFINAVAGACLTVEDAAATALDAGLIALEQAPAEALRRSAIRALRAGRPRDALGHAQRMRREHPERIEGTLLAAEALSALGETDRALALLDGASRGQADPRVLVATARARAVAGDAEGMRRAARRLVAASSGADGKSRAYVLQGDLERGLGNQGQALAAYQQAAQIMESPENLRALAREAAAQGRRGLAYRAAARLCELVPGDAWACQQKKAGLSAGSP